MGDQERTDELIRILGSYSLKAVLGRGVIGKLYLAENMDLKRPAAVRVLRSELLTEAGFESRFTTHLQKLSSIGHTNLTAIQTYGQTTDSHWFALDLAAGDGHGSVTLAEFCRKQGGCVEATLLTSLLGGVLRGVSELHKQGVTHGNLKPENILLYRLPDNRLVSKVTDFGMVSLIGANAWLGRLRKAVKESMKNRIPDDSRGDAYRALLKSREYMAPEMKRSGIPTPQSDIYSLGLMFYRLITGTKLSPRPPSHYNSALSEAHDRFILTALEPEPEDRYDSASDMLDALEPVRDLINQEVEKRHRMEVTHKVADIRIQAADLVAENKLEEARDVLWKLMEQFPGRQDVLDDYSSIEERLTELRRIADREEQYHWDISEARELEADGKMTEALNVWVLLSRLYSDKPEVMDEVHRLSEITGYCTEEEVSKPVDESELLLRKRISSYRRKRNEAWDLVDDQKFEEAFQIIEELKESVADRGELLSELDMIEEETLEVMDKALQLRRRKLWVMSFLTGAIILAVAVGAIAIWIIVQR